MSRDQLMQFGFSPRLSSVEDFVLLEDIIEDRGSRYSVSFGKVESRDDVKAFLHRLKSPKRYAKADHHSWALRIVRDGVLHEFKSDDGETGAGMVILNILRREDVGSTIVCVTRWFGGVKLLNDRYKHIQDATRAAVERLKNPL
jgi:putative IMPACT (imprinted ancient) family translation regulator